MNLTFIANACCIYESNGFKILCDPWLTPGCFYGSWFHYPPLKTKPEDISDYDLLYISHLHPDHFDPVTLKYFDKNKPVVILDQEKTNYLGRMLIGEGFTNIYLLKDGESKKFGPFTLTMFKPFVKHPFFECEVGNTIDSALVIDDGKHKVLNTNDNTPDLKSAEYLRNRFGQFDVAQLNYNAAGPYPSCFNNLSGEQKYEESQNIIGRNLHHIAEAVKILKPRFVMPFAGQYVIGGKNWKKNEYLGATSSDYTVAVIKALIHGQECLNLKENETFNCNSDTAPQFNYADSHRRYWFALANKKYDYEDECLPAKVELDCLMQDAIKNLRKAQERFHCYPDCLIVINDRWKFSLTNEGPDVCLRADLDPALLYWILTRKAHWNNAEIGCHIEFDRQPNIYQPDVHFLLSFLHV